MCITIFHETAWLTVTSSAKRIHEPYKGTDALPIPIPSALQLLNRSFWVSHLWK